MQSCSNYRCVKLISHSMKSCKRVVEDKLRVEVITTEQQCSSIPRKSTTDAMIVLRILMKKC